MEYYLFVLILMAIFINFCVLGYHIDKVNKKVDSVYSLMQDTYIRLERKNERIR